MGLLTPTWGCHSVWSTRRLPLHRSCCTPPRETTAPSPRPRPPDVSRTPHTPSCSTTGAQTHMFGLHTCSDRTVTVLLFRSVSPICLNLQNNNGRKKVNLSIYPFLYGVGLTNSSLCSGNAAGNATVALAHAPKFTADFLCACVEEELQNRRQATCVDKSSHTLVHLPFCYSDAYNTQDYVLLCSCALTTWYLCNEYKAVRCSRCLFMLNLAQ